MSGRLTFLHLLMIKVVRKGGLEPPRYCYRQPLKLVRLPIPPLPRGWPTFTAGHEPLNFLNR